MVTKRYWRTCVHVRFHFYERVYAALKNIIHIKINSTILPKPPTATGNDIITIETNNILSCFESCHNVHKCRCWTEEEIPCRSPAAQGCYFTNGERICNKGTKQMAVMKYDTYMCVIWPTMIHVETNHGALGDYGNKMRYHWSHNWRIVIISMAADALILINLW